MMGFTTVSSMFMCNMVLLICFAVSGELLLAMLPGAGSLLLGCGIVRILVVPEARQED